jgi:hypothetical protein
VTLRRPYRERILLLLVALTAFAFAYGPGWPDVSRLGLTQSIALDGTLRIDRYASQTGDKSFYGAHWYSDKAPGVSLVALPAFEAFRATSLAGRREEETGIWRRRATLWAARFLTGGLFFCACVLLVGRAAEALRPGKGAACAATFALGTMAMPLAATTFGHLAAGALSFAAFLLALRERPAAAGAFAGTAVVFEYPAVLAAAVIGLYLIWRSRRVAPVARFVGAAVPPLAILALYDAAAFGAPAHLSYRYSRFGGQHRDFYGVGLPSLHSLGTVLIGHRGLLTFSPVLVLAAGGLVLLWRRGLRAEATASGAVVVLFLMLAAGNWDPLGGLAPGPRYLAPALPFLALGLPELYARAPLLTSVLALASTGGMLYQAGTYGPNYDFSTVWWWLGLPRPLGFALVLASCAAAIVVAAASLRTPRERDHVIGERR